MAALTRRTGVPADTIRKWEQRYGVLQPERTGGGQRRYSELDVARIEWLKDRLAEGFRIGEAAALLGTATVGGGSSDELRRAVVEATLRSDVSALVATIEQSMLLGPAEQAFAEVLTPALVEIGELWETGRLSVAQEHLASSVVRAALQRLLTDQRGAVRGVAVLACAPGERHEIGLLMLAVLMRVDGWQVAYLGADTPAADAVALARELQASALLFSATLDESAAALTAELRGLDLPAGVTPVVGGRATDRQSPAETVAGLR